MNLKIEEDNCIGCGLCQAVCPECFVLKNGVAKIVTDLEKEDCCDCQEIIDSCPCNAIKIKIKNNEK